MASKGATWHEIMFDDAFKNWALKQNLQHCFALIVTCFESCFLVCSFPFNASSYWMVDCFLRSWRKMWELCMGLEKKRRVALAITLQRQKCKTLETVFWCKLRCVNVDLFLPWCQDRIAFMLLIPQCFGKNDGTKTWLWESTCQGQRYLEKDCGKLSTPSKAWKTPCRQKFFRMLFMEWASQKEPKSKVVVSVIWFN